MPEQRVRSYNILARIQAIVGGLIAVGVFAAFGIGSGIVSNTGEAMASAILGLIGAVYYLTLHRVVAKKSLTLSTLILTGITSINLIILIASTGGLDSPYYSLWLLAIIVAGIFGRNETFAVLGVTIVYYIYELVHKGFQAPYVKDHLVQLFITLITAGLAEWVHSRSRTATATKTKLADLSGQLTAEQLKAEAIMSSIGEGVIVVDAARKIQLFNTAAQQITGWDEGSAQAIDYNLVLQLKTASDQPITEANDPFVEALHKRGTVTHDDLVMTTRSGRKIQLYLTVSPIFNGADQASGAIALFRDVSHEKEVGRQKDEFVSTASHEMRTPVAAIEGYISLAMNPNVATIDDRAKKYLEKAHETIKHLGELFRDLLSVTKAEEGQLNLKIEPINIGELMQSVVDDMQFTVQKKNLTLVYQIGGQTGKAISPLYFVAANPERLREVVMNLIDNACKFTSEGGIKVALEGNDKEITVGVSDTGVGIAAEDMPHLFQKFYRIDNSATRTIGGTGLGLYLCRRVIELFNGRIWIESKAGEGSTFRFSLPRLSELDISRMKTSQTAAAGAAVKPGGTVLPAIAPTVAPTAPSATPAQPTLAAIAMPVPGEHAVPVTIRRQIP